jgi:hypothetical protein
MTFMIMDAPYHPPGTQITPRSGLTCLGCQPQLGASLNGPMSTSATILGGLALAAVILTMMSYTNGKGRR